MAVRVVWGVVVGGEDCGGCSVSWGGDGGLVLWAEVVRIRFMLFRPTVTKEEISGAGGSSGSGFDCCALLRFLLRLPWEGTMWLARCCPMGESVLWGDQRRAGGG